MVVWLGMMIARERSERALYNRNHHRQPIDLLITCRFGKIANIIRCVVQDDGRWTEG